MTAWLALVGAILFNTLGNLFIKSFSIATEVRSPLDYLTPAFILGMAFFGSNVVLYSFALKSIPIVVAYPILVGMSLAAVSLVAVFWFKESFGLSHLLGVVFVTIGIICLARAGN